MSGLQLDIFNFDYSTELDREIKGSRRRTQGEKKLNTSQKTVYKGWLFKHKALKNCLLLDLEPLQTWRPRTKK